MNMAINKHNAEHKEMMVIDFIGILTFRNPYVSPVLKLSRLTANASSSKEKSVFILIALPIINTILYGMGLSDVKC